jgi:hypothetical protein
VSGRRFPNRCGAAVEVAGILRIKDVVLRPNHDLDLTGQDDCAAVAFMPMQNAPGIRRELCGHPDARKTDFSCSDIS